MRQNGLEAAVKRAAGKVPIFGICGGYQMLGCEIADPFGGGGGQIRGMELLPVRTVLQKEKHRCQIDGNWKRWKAFSPDLRDMSSRI